MTLKAMNYVSSMRSNLALMRRSKDVRSADLLAASREFSSYLASRVLIYPPTMRSVGLRPDMTYQEAKSTLNIGSGGGSISADEAEFSAFLETSARKSRKASWIWRIGSENEEMRDRGWYPFFVTLTVDPSRVPDSQAMWEEGREFRRYIRRLARVSARACGVPNAIRDGASCSAFVRHVGVIEHGKSRHHHHMHLLVWMRNVPSSWKVDPNRGIRDPSKRVVNYCRQMGTYWPNSLPGLGRALFFRFEGDAWSKLGFCIPVGKDGKPFFVSSARAAGYYVSKYMDKGDKAWLHRVKATRDLGKGRLRNLLNSLPLPVVEALTWRPRRFSQSVLVGTTHCVPSQLLRSMAKQVHFCRTWGSSRLVPRSWIRAPSSAYMDMRKSVRDGMRPHRMCLKEFYEWVSDHLPVPDGYCERRLQRAHVQLMADFPPNRFSQVSHVGGSNHGHS